MPFATSAISVYEVTVGTKMEPFFWRGTKSGKKKNLGTKTGIGSKCRDQNVIFAFIKRIETLMRYRKLVSTFTAVELKI